MKTLKITLLALLTIGLLTAVLPSSKIEPTDVNPDKEVKHAKSKLTAFTERDKGNTPPENG